MAASAFQHKVQRAPARSILLYSSRRVHFSSYGLGDSQPMQLSWLAAIFGGYNAARVWHFWLLWVYVLFVVPHVILVFADGWDTLRSMIVGWTARVKRSEFTSNEE
jgi:thiosulfate reductase cytochrome b subunit